MPVRVPPGRAGRIWLAERRAVGARAAEMLDQKQRLLRREHQRLTALAERTARQWEVSVGEAETWCTRALVSGGREALRRATFGRQDAVTRIVWANEAGAAFPATAECELPAGPDLGTETTLARAADAYRRALGAGVRHAAAAAAADRIGDELEATTRRLRALRERWLPDVERQLADLDARLDEIEREEATRLRWARRHRTETER